MDALKKLPQIAVGYKSELNRTKHGVLDGTRTIVLDNIMRWAKASDDGQQIYIISGGAGTGKSTIAFTIAERLEKANLLGGSFFFARGSAEVSDTKLFFGSLALQMAHLHSDIRPLIVQAIQKRCGTGPFSLPDEFRDLILDPLSSLPSNHPPIVLVIDALDECRDPNDSRLLFQVIESEIHKATFPFKVLLTGRPDAQRDFTRLSNCILHNIKNSVVEIDISRFLRCGLLKISSDYNKPADWFTEEDIWYWVKRCQGLFIYAATLLQYLTEEDFSEPWTNLHRLRAMKISTGNEGPEAALDQLYTQVLLRLFDGGVNEYQQERRLAKLVHPVVGFVVLLYQGLSSSSLAQLLQLDPDTEISTGDDIRAALRRLGSVILVPQEGVVDQEITVLHASFLDFITDKGRCGRQHQLGERLFVDPAVYHSRIAYACLTLIIHSRENTPLSEHGLIGGDSEATSQPTDDASKLLSPELQYACSHVLSHVLQLNHPSKHLLDKINDFVGTCLLYWIGVTSLLGRLGTSIRILSDTVAWAKVRHRSRFPGLSETDP